MTTRAKRSFQGKRTGLGIAQEEKVLAGGKVVGRQTFTTPLSMAKLRQVAPSLARRLRAGIKGKRAVQEQQRQAVARQEALRGHLAPTPGPWQRLKARLAPMWASPIRAARADLACSYIWRLLAWAVLRYLAWRLPAPMPVPVPEGKRKADAKRARRRLRNLQQQTKQVVRDYEPPLTERGAAIVPGKEGLIYPGVRGYAIKHDGNTYIPVIVGTGTGRVSELLDRLSPNCRIPCVVSEQLRGMLIRHGWRKAYEEVDGETVDVWAPPVLTACPACAQPTSMDEAGAVYCANEQCARAGEL